MIERRAYLALLFDFYSGLLTEKQKNMFDLYYQCDLSLGEIADEFRVSRQAVFDIIKRTENTLIEYENKLQLAKKYQKNKDSLQEALNKINWLNKNSDDIIIEEIKELLLAVLKEY